MKLPDALRCNLRRLEWTNKVNLRKRLVGERPFPLRVSLQPPTGPEAMRDMAATRNFVTAWAAVSSSAKVEWERRRLQGFATLDIPATVTFNDLSDLAAFLGEEESQWHTQATYRIAALSRVAPELGPAAIAEIHPIMTLHDHEFEGLSTTLPQLTPACGRGLYRRALPLRGVDTKFAEQHWGLLTTLLDRWHNGGVTAAGSLDAWLELEQPSLDALLVRPLCPALTSWFLGLATLRLGWRDLYRLHPPCQNLIVVENETSIYALPMATGTLAIAGTGGNLAWLAADWVQQTRTAYWGDMDTDGLRLLAQARFHAPHLESVLMDEASFNAAKHRAVSEPEARRQPIQLQWLTTAERSLLKRLEEREPRLRLEQERLDGEMIHAAIQKWEGRNA